MDPGGKVFKYSRIIRLMIYSWFCTFFTKIVASLKGVSVGSQTKFYKIPYFNRYTYSVIKIGKACTFKSDKTSNLIGVNRRCIIATLARDAELIIGNRVGFSGTSVGCASRIAIGDNTIIGANVVITDTDWHAADPDLRRNKSGKALSAPVIIGENVWIGLNSIVLKGVTIGDNTIIGASSVVTRSIPANKIAGGNPCKVIKGIED